MILSKEAYWHILEYTVEHLCFIENPLNPSELTAIDTSEEKGVWLGDIMKEFTTVSCSKEAILSAFHILVARDIIRANYFASKKDHRIIDLTAKGYEEYLKKHNVI